MHISLGNCETPVGNFKTGYVIDWLRPISIKSALYLVAITNPISCILNQYSSRQERLLNYDTDRMMFDMPCSWYMQMYNSLFLCSHGASLYGLAYILHCFLLQHAPHIDIHNYRPTTFFHPSTMGKYGIRNVVVVWFCLIVLTIDWCMRSTTSTTFSLDAPEVLPWPWLPTDCCSLGRFLFCFLWAAFFSHNISPTLLSSSL